MDKYTIVIERNLVEMIEKVNELVEAGWLPQGGVIQTHDAYFAQAMFKQHTTT